MNREMTHSQRMNIVYARSAAARREMMATDMDELIAQLPHPGKLIALAAWFDTDDALKGREGHGEVQGDLREWAVVIAKLKANCRAALAKAGERP
jgi:hypothetical protein